MIRFNILLIFSLIFCTSCNAQQKNNDPSVTTYFFLRHTEKDTSDQSNRDPELTEEGKLRADKWAQIVSDTPIDMVFSTDYKRTVQTANPIAQLNKVDITFYNPNELNSSEFEKQTIGKTSVIVGHSNTTPKFINKILKQDKYDDINEEDYGKLFIVKISDGCITDTVLSIN